METIQSIYSRQSQGEVLPDPVPASIIRDLLAAAVQAPNHYRVRPWRFVVVSGDGLARMGDVLARSFSQKFPLAPSSALEKEKNKPQRAPLIIAVGVDLPTEPKVDLVENICAASAAVQNLLLAAHALGLAVKWRTGEESHDPLLKEFLGLSPAQPLIALLYIGWPASITTPATRPTSEDRVVWMD